MSTAGQRPTTMTALATMTKVNKIAASNSHALPTQWQRGAILD
jgi:hypothetical protein